MLDWIEDEAHFEKLGNEHKEFLVLAFYGEFSESSKRALSELEKFSADNEKTEVCVVDVARVKGLHKKFGVDKVPTVLILQQGKITHRIGGVQSARFYERIASGAQPARRKKDGAVTPRRVVVYSGPGCPACAGVKSYLRRRGVPFREIDIGKDRRAAEKLMKRSGQMAVPQVDINGRLVVGFDRSKLDRLLF